MAYKVTITGNTLLKIKGLSGQKCSFDGYMGIVTGVYAHPHCHWCGQKLEDNEQVIFSSFWKERYIKQPKKKKNIACGEIYCLGCAKW